ncbi:MAG TPA: hypothetical protein VLL97_13020 [Acidobacteriota bacterium]|nr:hypothetical protein [Acidobacteriota bacterium]
MKIFSILVWPFRKLYKLFTSEAAKSALSQIDELIPQVIDIVENLRAFDPKTATVADIIELYRKHKVELVGTLLQDPVSIGNALLNLATFLVKQREPNKSTSVIQAAIQLALVALKAE